MICQKTDVKNLVKEFIKQQQEAILDTELLNNFWISGQEKFKYDFLLLHDATIENKTVPEGISEQVKDFYRLIPTNTINIWLYSKNKTFSTHVLLTGKTPAETEANLQLVESMTSALQAKETRTFFHTLAEQTSMLTGKDKWEKEHPFGNFKDMAPALFTVLSDSAHDGPEFRHKLTVIERTFRNNLNREGEFVNLNHAFVKKGTEFSGYKKYEGEDISTIDWHASARKDEPIIKRTHHEEEPKHNLCLVNLDNLVMKNQKEFEPHARWETIFTETYDKLFSLMIDFSHKNKPWETRLYFHGQEIFKTGLPRFTPLPQQQETNRISMIRDAVSEIFAEINKFIPLLQEEYVIHAKEKTVMPFLKPEFLPNLRTPESTNLIVVNNRHNVSYLAKMNQAAASRVV